MSKRTWMDEKIIEALETAESQKKNPYFINLAAISNVPLIKFPGFTSEEQQEVQEQAKNVLRISRNSNMFKEIAITYKKGQSEKPCIVKGDYRTIPLMEDESTRSIIDSANKANELIIINLHNHPNNSGFSVSDLIVFSENPSIKLMMLINTQGKVSFLMRPNELDLSGCVTSKIAEIAPDYRTRRVEWEANHPDINCTLSDLIDKDSLRLIQKESLIDLRMQGVVFSDYIGQKEADNFQFPITNTHHQANAPINLDQNKHNTPMINLLESDLGIYLENGEDGHDWEFE